MNSTYPQAPCIPLPDRLRIQSLVRLPHPQGGIRNRAVLSDAQHKVCVEWISAQVDARLRRHDWVTVKPPAEVFGSSGVIPIQRLRHLPLVHGPQQTQ